MKQNRSIITTSLAFASFAALALAHGGFEHVMGTVTKVEGGVLTVKTNKGEVPVKLDAKTVITKGTTKATVADLMPGVRVVVDLPEKVKDPAAASVKIGAAPATAPATKETHEHK